jgi:hypothetical protein
MQVYQQSRRVEHDSGERSIPIELRARRLYSLPKSCYRCVVTSVHRIGIHRRNLICGCHTTRGVKQPYTLTEALRHGGPRPGRQRAAQLMGSNRCCDVSSQCVILTYLCFTEQKKNPMIVSICVFVLLCVYPRDRARNPLRDAYHY